ncbi:MAG: NAD(P)H-binding protein [Chloroflexi bacterium]|nr:NAD(P)H-binding protein [Chloroflexota bacterium]
MRVLILGATGKIGRLALERALADGHDVVALVRETSRLERREGLAVVTGSIGDVTVIRGALEGSSAVIAAVGPRSNTAEDELALEVGMRNLTAAMEVAGVHRLIALSGAAVAVPGDRKPLLDQLASVLVRRFARHVVGAKQREYEVFSATALDWTALRPPLVIDGPPKGYRLAGQLKFGARVSRADVAQALVDQLADTRFGRAAPFVLPKDRP